MDQIKRAGDFSSEIGRELEEIQAVAAGAEQGLRTLRDLEMGWVAGGGDGMPVWG
jgi:hypothetical protein